MNPARILFALGTLSGGGSERRMIDLLGRLDRRQFAPELFLAYRTGELLTEVPADVPVHAFTDGAAEQSWGQQLARRMRLLSEMRMRHLDQLLRSRHYDLIFAWGLRRAYETALPARRRRVPRAVYCVQDPRQEIRVDFPFRSPWRWPVSRWAYRTADRIFANSPDLCRCVESFYRLPSETVEHLPNLRDFSRLDDLAQSAAPDWPGSGVRLLTVGRLQEQKGHAALLDAVAELVHHRHRDVQLVICGAGPLESALKDQVRRLNLESRVTLAGYVANPYPYFQTADLFILPSLWEGSPNTLIEAVALGTPVVSTDCPTGPREILGGGRHGVLVPPGDRAALVNAIDAVVQDHATARNRAADARSAIRARYDLDSGIEHFQDRLRDVIQRSPRR